MCASQCVEFTGPSAAPFSHVALVDTKTDHAHSLYSRSKATNMNLKLHGKKYWGKDDVNLCLGLVTS